MADFSFLSDTDDSAVEEILAEAADHITLKQISALNLSGVSDSVLPQHLESRFRRLKTLPSSLPQRTTRPPPESEPDDKPAVDSALKPTEPTRYELGSSSEKAIPDPKLSSKPKSRSGSSSRRRRSRSPSPSPSPSFSSESSNSWLESKNSPKLTADKGLFGSDRQSGFGSSKPKKKTPLSGLWGSAKRALKKMSFSKRSGSGGGNGSGIDWGGNDGVLVGSISMREQEKILKRAAKEEMKINAEAQKIVKWAKQVSARMEAFGLDHDDDELPYK